jgi:hypothetical protein
MDKNKCPFSENRIENGKKIKEKKILLDSVVIFILEDLKS